MREQSVRELVEAAGELIQPRLKSSEPLRRLARALGEWLIEQAAEAGSNEHYDPVPAQPPPAPSTLAPPATQPPENRLDPAQNAPSATPPEPCEPAPRIAPTNRTPSPDTIPSLDPAPDLPRLSRRVSLLAQGCELAAQRQQSAADANRLRQVDGQISELRTQAGRVGTCHLWMLDDAGSRFSPADLTTLRDCYRAVEQAIQVLHALEASPLQVQSEQRVYTLTLLAEAASSLEVALVSVGSHVHDATPGAVRAWLRGEAGRTRVSISRFMSDDDQAEPAEVAGLLERIQNELTTLSDKVQHGNDHKRALSRVKYGVDQVLKDRDSTTEHHLDHLLNHVESALEQGVSPKDPKLLQAVRPLVHGLIDGMRPHEQEFLDRLSEQLFNDVPIDLDDDLQPLDESTWTPDVVRVRGRLRGRDLVLVGGLPKPHVRDRLKQAFELREVLWVQINEHTSSGPIKPLIERPSTAVVCMIIRWSGHQMVDDVRQWCRDAGKPVISVTGGPHPNRIAHAIVHQASEKLGLV